VEFHNLDIPVSNVECKYLLRFLRKLVSICVPTGRNRRDVIAQSV
jgi:hypothetical protein